MRPIIKFFISISLFLFSCFGVSGSELNKFQFGADYLHSFGLVENGLGMTFTDGMHSNAIRFSGLYNINPLFSAGIGVGVEVYEPHRSSLPIYASGRWRPLQKPLLDDFYVLMNMGYSVSMDDDHILTSGFLGEAGIGWQKMLRRHFGLNLQFGYQLKQFHLDTVWCGENGEGPYNRKSDFWRQSLFLSFGLVF